MSSNAGGAGAIHQPSSPPYFPTNWALGGAPVVGTDVPISAVFLVLFICGAIAHMTILQLNNRRGHKFLFSGMLFGFCMARTTTLVLRIASTCKPHNIRLSIAASIFVAAGVLLIFVINLIFAQRLIRAQHPNWGWHKGFSLFFKVNYVLIVATLIMVITATVQTFYTLNPNTRRIDRNIQLAASTYLMYISFLPIPTVILSLLLPRKQHVDKFGSGRFRTKIIILLTSSFLVCFGAAYRCSTSWRTPVPRTEPLPTYFNKGAFYVANFVVEILVVFLYAILRVDLRFHIPNGAHGKGSYTAGANIQKEQVAERPSSRIYTEEETFDSDPETAAEHSDVESPVSKESGSKI